MKTITFADVQNALKEKKSAYHDSYLAMYSSWLGGITQDPLLMFVPVDDHMVHRGDGVFEAIKTVNRKVFLLQPHLQRLAKSAEAISLRLPYSISEIENIILQTLKVADHSESLIRLYISRGPGGFTTNPYESIGAQLYIVITKLKPVAEEKYLQGVSIKQSQIPVKDGWMAQIKSCNYLYNVLMKKESVDQKVDFTVAINADGYVAESSTENIALLTRDKEFLYPSFDYTLRGTTLLRTAELAKNLQAQGLIKSIREANIHSKELSEAEEIFMIGTTLDVLPVTKWNGSAVAGGQVGAVAKALLKALREDQKNGVYVGF